MSDPRTLPSSYPKTAWLSLAESGEVKKPTAQGRSSFLSGALNTVAVWPGCKLPAQPAGQCLLRPAKSAQFKQAFAQSIATR